MKLFFKRFMLFAVIFGFTVAFVACTEDTTTATTTEQQTTQGETTTEAETTTVDLLAAVPNMIIIDSSDQITGDFLLPGSVQGVTITYTSSNTDVVVISATTNADGFYTAVVTNPSIPDGGVNTSVTITGTMTLGTDTDTFTKSIRVMAQNLKVVDDIADLYASLSLGDVTEITGIVYATFSGGFFIYDASGTLGVYDSSITVAIGDEITLKGALATYYTLYQLSDIATYTINSNGNAITLVPMVLDNGAYIAEADSSEKALHGTIFTVTAKLAELTSGTYTNMFLLDVNGEKIAQIYHYGNADSLAVLNDNFLDEIITLDVVYYTDHGDVVYVVFDGVVADVTVSATDAEIAAFYANALEIDDEFVKNTTVELPTTIGTAGTVAWAVGTGETNVTFVDEAATFGEVTGDTTATVVATVTVDVDGTDVVLTRTFSVTILDISAADLVEQDKVALVVDKTTAAELDTMDLPTEGDAGSTIAWAVTTGEAFIVGEDEVVFDYTGVAQTVTLTATITNGIASGTKVFSVAVTTVTLSTVAEILAAADGDSYVKGNVYYLTKNGFYLEDATGKLFIYTYSIPTVEIGDEVVATGEYTAYHGSAQLQYPTVSSALTVDNDVDQTSLGAFVPDTTVLAAGESYTLTGILRYGPVEVDGYSNLYLEDTAGDPYAMFYYKSDGDSYYMLKDLVGTNVTFDAVYYNMDAIEMFVFFGDDTVVTLNGLSDAATVVAALTVLYIPSTVTSDTTLDLPATLFGVALTYVSSDITHITDAGLVTTTADMQFSVTITVTANFGTVVDETEDFVVQVGDLPVSDVSDIYDTTLYSNGDMIKVQGILTMQTKYNAFWLQDDTAGINLYAAYDDDLQDLLAGIEIGSEIEVVAEIASFNGLFELTNFTVKVINDEPALPTPADINNVDFTDAALLEYQGQLVSFDLFVLEAAITASSGSSFNFTLVSILDNSVSIGVRVESSASGYDALYAELVTYTTASVISVNGGVIGWYNGYQLGLSEASQVDSATEYDVLLLDLEAAFEGETVFGIEEGSTIEVPLTGEYGTTFTYDFAELEAVGATFDEITGELVIPSSTEDIDYNIPVTVVFGSARVRLNLTLTVYFMSDDDKLAADTDGLEIVLTAMEYDSVDLETLWWNGSVVTWVVTSGDATIVGNEITYNFIGAQQTVVLTATLTYTKDDLTTITATKEFSVVVEPITIITDFSTLYTQTESVWDVANDVTIYVQGVVTGFGNGVVYIQDANGVGVKIDNDFNTLVIGEEVLFRGIMEEDGLVRQLAWNSDLLVAAISTGNVIIDTDMTIEQVINISVADTGRVITVSGLKLTSVGYYLVLEASGTSEVMLLEIWNGDGAFNFLSELYIAGDALGEVTFTFTKVDGSDLRIENLIIVLTEQQKADLDVNNLDTTLDLFLDYILPTPNYGSSYTVTGISASLTTYIDYTTTPGTLIVLMQPVGADLIGTVTIDVVNGLVTETVTLNVTLLKYIAPLAAGTYVETFATFPETSSSYADGTFIGVAGVLWTYDGARGDQNITDDAFCLNRLSGDAKANLSANINGGISSISVDFRNAFTTGAAVEIYINGVLVGTSTIVTDKVAITYTISGLDITGPFTLMIKTTNGQLVIDNLTWTTNPAS